ncbi:MAG: glycosyltransferase family 39 protein [Ectothiorhodospiraceae bacterium]|jgi:4-amino-4-deoxy-L-arabinose transferase-like glycosyltransferase
MQLHWTERLTPAAWLLLAFTLATLWYGLGSFPLFDLDEGAFAEATREMLASGNYVTTYLNGEPRFDKPILIYWLQAASAGGFGITEWAFRLPSTIAATLWAFAVFAFTRRVEDTRTGLFAALILASSLVVTVIARAATADAVLNLFIGLSGLWVYRYYLEPSRGRLLTTFAFMALGFLTKGPIAVAVPVGASFLFYLSMGRWRDWLRAAFNPLGWLVLLAIALPWYVLEYLDQGQAFIDGFFLKHNLGRFSDTMESHGGELYYYLVVTPLAVLPYTGLLAAILPTLRRMRADALDRYLWIWFLMVFVVFSLSGTQLPHYILYGGTPLFILMARHRDRLRSRWLAFTPPVLFLAVVASLPLLMPHVLPQVGSDYDRSLLSRYPEAFGTAYAIWSIAGVAAVLALALWRRWTPAQGLVAAGAIQAVVIMNSLLPAVAELQQVPVKQAAMVARELDAPVVAYRIRMPSFSVYLGRPTLSREPTPGDLVYTRVDRLEDLNAYHVLYRKGGIALVRVLDES